MGLSSSIFLCNSLNVTIMYVHSFGLLCWSLSPGGVACHSKTLTGYLHCTCRFYCVLKVFYFLLVGLRILSNTKITNNKKIR